MELISGPAMLMSVLTPPISRTAPIVVPQVWSTKGVEGVHRFLARVYRLVTEQPLSDAPPSADQLRQLHQTIKKVGRLLGRVAWCGGSANKGRADLHPTSCASCTRPSRRYGGGEVFRQAAIV